VLLIGPSVSDSYETFPSDVIKIYAADYLTFSVVLWDFQTARFLTGYMERWMSFKLVIALANVMHHRIICPQHLNICDIVGEVV